MKNTLSRIKANKMLGGVVAGLAAYFNIDVTLVRIFMVGTFFTPIPVVIPYLILWVVMPSSNELEISKL